MHLLMIDDDPAIGNFVRNVAELLDYAVETYTTAEAFKRALDRNDPDVIVLDLTFPDTDGIDGIELLRYLSNRRARARIFIMSGFDPAYSRMAVTLGEAQGLTMAGMIPKPVHVAELMEVLAPA